MEVRNAAGGNANYAWLQHIASNLSPTRRRWLRPRQRFAVQSSSRVRGRSAGHGRSRPRGLHRRPAGAAVLHHADSGLPLVPQPGQGKGTAARDTKYRDRRGEILFIDARKLGHMIDRTHRDLTDDDIGPDRRNTYHAWRGEPDAGTSPTCRVSAANATLEQIAAHGFVLTPGRYVGAEEAEDDGEPFGEDGAARLTRRNCSTHSIDSRALEELVRTSLITLDEG